MGNASEGVREPGTYKVSDSLVPSSSLDASGIWETSCNFGSFEKRRTSDWDTSCSIG